MAVKSTLRASGKRTALRIPGKNSKVKVFRSLKKMLFGKSQARSLDLLDRWILKKRPLSLFL